MFVRRSSGVVWVTFYARYHTSTYFFFCHRILSIFHKNSRVSRNCIVNARMIRKIRVKNHVPVKAVGHFSRRLPLPKLSEIQDTLYTHQHTLLSKYRLQPAFPIFDRSLISFLSPEGKLPCMYLSLSLSFSISMCQYRSRYLRGKKKKFEKKRRNQHCLSQRKTLSKSIVWTSLMCCFSFGDFFRFFLPSFFNKQGQQVVQRCH